MNSEPMLQPQEWQLVLDLLMQERRELPPEIRHTDALPLRDELRQRLRTVDDLIARLQQGVPAA